MNTADFSNYWSMNIVFCACLSVMLVVPLSFLVKVVDLVLRSSAWQWVDEHPDP